jgi:hypothetical protein
MHGVSMEKPCQKLLSMLEVLNQLKSLGGEDAHHAQEISGDVASGHKSVEDTIQEVKRLKVSPF